MFFPRRFLKPNIWFKSYGNVKKWVVNGFFCLDVELEWGGYISIEAFPSLLEYQCKSWPCIFGIKQIIKILPHIYIKCFCLDLKSCFSAGHPLEQ